MQRRVLFARALMHHPDLLILDEPTAGIDVELRADLWEFIRRLHAGGTTVLLTTHYLEEAEALCDEIVQTLRIGFLGSGDIPAGVALGVLWAFALALSVWSLLVFRSGRRLKQ